MAKHITNRGYKELANEMFFGNRPAIKKYRLARHTQYEIDLLDEYRRPFNEAYFVHIYFFDLAFLTKAKGSTKEEKWKDARQMLNEAVGDGTEKGKSCCARCIRLMKELNLTMPDEDRMTYEEMMALIDWLTFDFSYIEDENSFIKRDEKYGYPLLEWHDEDNFNRFKDKLKEHLNAGEETPYKTIWYEVVKEQYAAKPDSDSTDLSFLD